MVDRSVEGDFPGSVGPGYHEAEKQLAEMRGKFAIIDRLKLAGGEAPAEAPAGPPAVEEDIFGAVKHVSETLAQMQKREADEKAAKEANEKAAAEQKTFVENYRKDAGEFESKTPDFKAAYNFLLNSRAAELKAIGYQVIGESACASPENFDAAMGRRIARDKARNNIWALEGYLLRSKLATGMV